MRNYDKITNLVISLAIDFGADLLSSEVIGEVGIADFIVVSTTMVRLQEPLDIVHAGTLVSESIELVVEEPADDVSVITVQVSIIEVIFVVKVDVNLEIRCFVDD